jgi:hypothetical protein
LSKRINGGDIGLADRQHRYNVAMQALTGDIPPRAPISAEDDAHPASWQQRATAVKQMQQKLGIPADGDFGPGTEAGGEEMAGGQWLDC